MSIATVQSAGRAGWGAYFHGPASKSVGAPAAPQSSAAYTLSISDQGRAMAEKAGADPKSQAMNTAAQKEGGAPDNDLPLEALSLPHWLGSYLPDAVLATPEIDYGFWDMAEGLRKDNSLSNEDRRQLIGSYLQNDPKHQAKLAKDEFSEQFKGEIAEYANSLHTCYREALEENGVNSPADYYEKVVLDKEYSEKIHQSLQERIESNPRMLELMAMLEVNPATTEVAGG